MLDMFSFRSKPRSPVAAPAAALVAALFITACGEQPAPPPEAGEGPTPELGVVAFPTSCSDEVQPTLERGLALIHHMMYAQAETLFEEAARTDEGCAMAYWGLAMSHFQPFWGSADIEAGREAAERAVALEPPTERERAYAAAALAFFEEEGVSYAARVRNWEAAMTELHEAFPDDQEAAALFALAHLSVAPDDRDRQDRVARLLEELHRAEPLHPGAIHYAIHAHDVEHRAEDGVDFAAAYEDIAPSVPHALHMPSHIYVRLGAWDEVIHWNRESADAALQHPAGEYVSLHYPHALDYLMYGYLQKGEDDAARAVLEELRSEEGYQPHLATAYALAAIPARWHVERRDWEGAAALEAGVPAEFPWNDFPGAAAMTHFARGLGAAHIGDVAAARAELDRLAELEAEADQAEDYHWARQIEVQRRGVSAWIALVEDRPDAALEEMAAAAELAAGMEKHPVSPGDLQPARELLGDMLMELDRPDEALRAYEASLETWPNRYHTLLGAARAATAAGMEAEAQAHYEALADLVADAAPDRDGVAEARERAGSPAGAR
jgi:tetratricopeptide (TPR) repeat protein